MKAEWTIQTINDVAEVKNGGTPKSKIREYWEGEVEWLTPKDMGKMDGVYINETPRKITELGLSKSSAKLVDAQSVIVSTRAPIGHLAINTVPMAFNQGCRGLTPKEGLTTKYLFYYLHANVQELNDLGTGTTFKELSAGALKSFLIPIPPLEEQKRIVAVLDAAFEGLDRARAHVETNLQNARELFESSMSKALECDATPKRFNEVCILQRGFDLPKRLRVEGEFPLVTSSGIKDTHHEFKVEGPGVATGRSGSIGNVFYIEYNFWPLNTALYIKQFHGNVPRFIWYFLRNFDLGRFASGAGVPTLNRNDVHHEMVRVPNKTQQDEIVKQLDYLEKLVSKLEAKYQAKLADLEDLRQSLLQKAFAGELT